MVSDGHIKHGHEDIRWPEVSSLNRVPTPYQIFDQKKGSPYSKKRFYELVKLYHPDRHDCGSAIDELSQEVKNERYRLVVAANEILSDPIKRSAFDLYGAGWNGTPGVRTSRDPTSSHAAYGGAGRAWSEPGGPSRNATWEDWEKWYGRNDPKDRQVPQFVSNGAFVSLIVMFAVLGGVGQATRVGNFSTTFVEQRDALHQNISKDLNRRRKETTTLWGSREERIDNFLRHRDPEGYEVLTDRGLRPTSDVCSSDHVKRRPMAFDKHFSNPKDG